jgi:FkbM family methyltransferase
MGSNMNYTYNGKEYEKIVFDVGANNGSSSVPLAIENPTYLVFAFEPTPEMIEVIKSKIVGLENYVIVPKAVSDYNGTAEFNVAGNWDWGCSSLLKFSRKSQTDWPGRTDFHVTYKLNVDVIRLDSFIQENEITKIDHLHIDTQGSDLNVMKGLGEYLHIVTEGKLEAGTSDDVLYEGQNKLNDCIKFLLLNGFKVVDVNSNDVFCHEVNVVFKK